MSRKSLIWTKQVLLTLLCLVGISVVGCHHYVCDGCGGCGGSCAGGHVYIVPNDQKSLLQPPAAESIRKLPTPTE